MNKIKKLFGEYELTYKKVIILAIISAIITAFFNIIPIFKDTSFSDMAVNLDVWFIYAIFIIVNSKKWYEASLKTFLFFLISQPLIYLLEVPFNTEGFGLFRYYIYWFYITLLTLPGAAIAYQLKRKDWLSVIVLAFATFYLSYANFNYLQSTLDRFPRHLLSSIFCLGLAIFLILVLFEDKKQITVSLLIIPITIILCFIFTIINNRSVTKEVELPSGSWACSLDDETLADISVEGNILIIKSKKSGYFIAKCINDENKKVEYSVLIDGQNISIGEVN